MIDPTLRAVVERLKNAGTVFKCVCIDTRTRKPLPDDSPLWELDAGEWDAVWFPEWELLADDHPEAAFVFDQFTRFYTDPNYERRLSDAACDIDCDFQEVHEEDDARDWSVPDERPD